MGVATLKSAFSINNGSGTVACNFPVPSAPQGPTLLIFSPLPPLPTTTLNRLSDWYRYINSIVITGIYQQRRLWHTGVTLCSRVVIINDLTRSTAYRPSVSYHSSLNARSSSRGLIGARNWIRVERRYYGHYGPRLSQIRSPPGWWIAGGRELRRNRNAPSISRPPQLSLFLQRRGWEEENTLRIFGEGVSRARWRKP